MAYLVLIPLNSVLGESGKPLAAYGLQVQHMVQTLTMLANGFIVTSLLWATVMARIIDGRMGSAAAVLALAAPLALFGVIHSPLPSAAILEPTAALRQLQELGRAAATEGQTPWHWAAAYLAMAGTLLVVGKTGHAPRHKDLAGGFTD